MQNKCHDCKKEETFEEYETPFGTFYKCEECFKKDIILRNFRPIDVFSRVTGYYSPVRNWNVGKKAEFKDRKVYKTS